MKQPKYLILNPVFNKYPNNWIPYNYVNKREPYLDFYGEMRWRIVRKFQNFTLNFEINDITEYNDYRLNDFSKIWKRFN